MGKCKGIGRRMIGTGVESGAVRGRNNVKRRYRARTARRRGEQVRDKNEGEAVIVWTFCCRLRFFLYVVHILTSRMAMEILGLQYKL